MIRNYLLAAKMLRNGILLEIYIMYIVRTRREVVQVQERAHLSVLYAYDFHLVCRDDEAENIA